MANDGKNAKSHGQLSMPLVIRGGRDSIQTRGGQIVYRSSEFYTLRDKLVESLPDKKKPKS